MTQYEKLIKDKYLHIKYCISDSQIKDIINPSKDIEYEQQVSSRRSITKKWMGAKYLCDSDLKYMKFVELEDGHENREN